MRLNQHLNLSILSINRNVLKNDNGILLNHNVCNENAIGKKIKYYKSSFHISCTCVNSVATISGLKLISYINGGRIWIQHPSLLFCNMSQWELLKWLHPSLLCCQLVPFCEPALMKNSTISINHPSQLIFGIIN